MNHQDHQEFWEQAARRVSRRINIGFSLQRFLPFFLGLSLLQGCLLLLLRKLDTPQLPLWIGYGVAVLLVLALSAWWSRKRFFSLADGLVHLESRLRLHNRLTAARSGHTTWPEPIELPRAFRWSWNRLALPPLGAVVFLLLAGWIPLQKEAAPPPIPTEEPLAWQEIETWAETLDERDLVEEKALEQWREQVQQLRDQPAEDWYSHSSLEAGDNLRENAANSIQQLQSGLQKAAYPLTVARESLNDMPSGLQPLLQEQWLDALSELNSGNLKLNKEMLAKLAEVDFSNLQGLSQEQIDNLSKMLREGLATCEGISGTCPGGSKNGEPCPICGSSSCAGSGTGGIARGPGAAELTFREFPNLIDSDRRETVSNTDLSRAALGEKLGVTASAPEVDPDAQQQISAAGSAVLAGDGGDAVFHSRLTPAERERLQRYFD